jgi:hypothetical protein
MPDEVTEPSHVASTPKAKWPLSRIVLLALLAVAVGLLAMDWTRGRLPRDRAYDRLVAEMPAEEDDQPKGSVPPPQHAIGKDFEFWTTDKVHKLLGRTPDTTDEKPAANHIDAIMTETYRFPGAFKNYLLLVIYDKRAHVAVGGPQTTMSSVRRTD